MNRTDQIACESPAGVTLWGSAVRYGKLSQNYGLHFGRALEWGFLRFLALGHAWVPKCREVGSSVG
jgi:hypothetical protein